MIARPLVAVAGWSGAVYASAPAGMVHITVENNRVQAALDARVVSLDGAEPGAGISDAKGKTMTISQPTPTQPGERTPAMLGAGSQKAAGTQHLTGFRFVTADEFMQETVLGTSALTGRANAGQDTGDGLNPGCVSAMGPNENPTELCPV
ncbi:hypothetical protein [Arthrobacter sp. 24S4-2]|uniref:hypothetical protein n=1 Tax=Arthrobacter sp. 24S4-2 TaxID=2575374 RepID=UPI0015860CD3|nr:hypothetical protein [Arthrobacter sp. 24S4-2]